MKFICLSEGGGFYFPPCQLLNICGFRVLFDCPLDLSALSIFSLVPTCSSDTVEEDTSTCSYDTRDLESTDKKRHKLEKPLDASNLIRAEPWYRTSKNLHLWNASSIDIVLISSPMGMLGLPFLSRTDGFSAKIYATEATARLGQLMMEDLVAMHMEYRQIYGPNESCYPQWMKWEELDMLPSSLKDIVLGKDGTELGGWMPLYSAAHVKDCMQKVQSLKYAEETCYNGTLIIKALSSGLEIGACNWTISSPKGTVANLLRSCFVSSPATNFDYYPLKGSDIIIYSDFSTWNSDNNAEKDISYTAPDLTSISNSENDLEARAESLLKLDDGAEEKEKLAFICSCSIDSIKAGGSVLIPIGRLGIVLQLLEHIAVSLQSSNMKAPIFFISSVAVELLAFSDIIPEWLCKQRLEKMYSGHTLFDHVELLKDKRLHLFHAIHSLELFKSWKEPCIVFCPHWNLRLGPVVHLLQRWSRDPNSLLVMESGEHDDLSLLPYKPLTMKVLQCSFLSGIRFQKAQPLLNILQPKNVLFPEISRQLIPTLTNSISVTFFSENETLWIPKKVDSEIYIATDLSLQLHWTKLKHSDTSVARLKGQLFMEHGKYLILPGDDKVNCTESRSLLHLGKLDLENLLKSLQKMGINGSVEQQYIDSRSRSQLLVHILEPKKALIEMAATNTIITTDDEDLASLISKAICDILDSI